MKTSPARLAQIRQWQKDNHVIDYQNKRDWYLSHREHCRAYRRAWDKKRRFERLILMLEHLPSDRQQEQRQKHRSRANR